MIAAILAWLGGIFSPILSLLENTLLTFLVGKIKDIISYFVTKKEIEAKDAEVKAETDKAETEDERKKAADDVIGNF